MSITQDELNAEVLEAVNRCRYLGGEGRDVGYIRTMTERDKDRIVAAATRAGIVSPGDRENILQEALRFAKARPNGFLIVTREPGDEL